MGVDARGLVGRVSELGALRGWLEEARAGCGRVVRCTGEPGIGKTRLAQELAGAALARGSAVAWGRCVADEAAPALWPWYQVLRGLGADLDELRGSLGADGSDRYRFFELASDALAAAAAQTGGLVVVLDDVHWADADSALLLGHVADGIAGHGVLVLANARRSVPRLADLERRPHVERLDLAGFGLAEVAELLGSAPLDPADVLALTGGNPLFVQEVARSAADGTWRADSPPASVLEVVAGRLDALSPDCRRFVQAASIAGRDVSVAVVAAAIDEPVARCLALVDEALAHGILEVAGGEHRFVHALTRDAVEASLTTTERVALHRDVAGAIGQRYAASLDDHLADLARHWLAIAPFGEAATAQGWVVRAAEDAIGRHAFEEGARLWRAALDVDPGAAPGVRGHLLVGLARASAAAGDLAACAASATEAAGVARSAGDAALLAEAALAVDVVPDPAVAAVARRLCDDALAAIGPEGPGALRARLLAQASHLAYYDGRQDLVDELSAEALALARRSGDDWARIDALHARKEARPGPGGHADRLGLSEEMLDAAHRTGSARAAMWGSAWRIDCLVEAGQLERAADELPVLRDAAGRVGSAASAWQLDRVTAAVAQARGRFDEAEAAGRRAYDRMRPIEPLPATGAYLALRSALACHRVVPPAVVEEVREPFETPPRFRTMQRLTRAFVLVRAGLDDEASAWFQQAGPVDAWDLPAFFQLPGLASGLLTAAALDRADEVAELRDRLEPHRGQHVWGEGVAYGGPVDLALGRAEAVFGRLDGAVALLEGAVDQARRAGAQAFAAEAQFHLAAALAGRQGPGDQDRALALAVDADRLAQALDMTAYVERTTALVGELRGRAPAMVLTARELEVADLVANGLTNRQIAARLVISERTAQNHVQHILTKLGFSSRTQVAAWAAERRMSR